MHEIGYDQQDHAIIGQIQAAHQQHAGPDLSRKEQIPPPHGLPIPPGYLLSISYYAIIWVVLMLLAARLAFQKVDL